MTDTTRRNVLRAARRMWELGLVAATSGNVSARIEGSERIAITPSSIPYDTMTDEQIVVIDIASGESLDSTSPASWELPMHLEIYRARWDIGAIVHTHAPFVTALSLLGHPLPPLIDEMIVHLGGTIAVSEYAFTGTPEVGRNALAVLGDHGGVLLANHGNVCVGRDVDEALHAAVVMEASARAYLLALQAGEPKPLPDEAIRLGRRMYEERHLSKRRGWEGRV